MIAQLRSELLKQRTTRTSVALVVWMLVLVLVVVLLHVFGLSAGSLRVARNQPKVYGWGTTIGALFAAVAGAICITAEYRTGTIRPTLLAAPRRTRLIVAKGLAAALLGLGLGLAAEVLVSAIATAGFAARGIHVALDAGTFARLFAGGAAAAGLWAAIGVGVGAVVRNQVGAVVGLVVWLVLVEMLLLGDAPSVGRFAPGADAGALAGMLPSTSSSTLLGPAAGAGILVAYVLVAVTAGALTTERRDVD